MGLYEGLVYPAYLVVCGLLVLSGIATMIWVRLHGVLKWIVTAMWVATALQVLNVGYILLSGHSAPIVLTVGYLMASVVLVPLLGIGRLGEPDAALADPDPNRPVLQPDQIARVDGGAAVIIGIAGAVLAWRIIILLGG